MQRVIPRPSPKSSPDRAVSQKCGRRGAQAMVQTPQGCASQEPPAESAALMVTPTACGGGAAMLVAPPSTQVTSPELFHITHHVLVGPGSSGAISQLSVLSPVSAHSALWCLSWEHHQ